MTLILCEILEINHIILNLNILHWFLNNSLANVDVYLGCKEAHSGTEIGPQVTIRVLKDHLSMANGLRKLNNMTEIIRNACDFCI